MRVYMFRFEVLLESWDCGHALQLLQEIVWSSRTAYGRKTMLRWTAEEHDFLIAKQRHIRTNLAFGILRNLVKIKINTGRWKSRPSTSLLEYGTRQILVIQPLQLSRVLSYFVYNCIHIRS